MNKLANDISDVSKAWAVTGLMVGRELLNNGAESLKQAAGYLETVREQLSEPAVATSEAAEEQQ